MFRKLQFYVGCGCVCVYVWIKERKKQIFKDRERESMCKIYLKEVNSWALMSKSRDRVN